MTPPWLIRPVRAADDSAVASIIHDVMTEHACSGEGFAIHDPEVAAMSAAYRGPRAGYYVLCRGPEVLGGGGFAQLQGTDDADATAELRKMYFRPEARGFGFGRALIDLLLDEMRAAGFRRCYLETTSWMDQARMLYLKSGFAELPAAEGATGHHGCDRFFAREL